LGSFNTYHVLLYSVTEDLLDKAHALSDKYPKRIRIATQSSPIPHGELVKEFANSRVYLGASISDGISTSFLEALVQGAFPIQTNTSCANEWFEKGALGSGPALDTDEIKEKLLLALESNLIVDEAQSANKTIALKFLDSNLISLVARNFYQIK
jgi:hypothetical protein